MDPRGFPTSLPEFQRVFPDDGACARYLESLRWPSGFVCLKCGWRGEPYRFAGRPRVLRCRNCQANASLTSGTVMEKSQSPLSTWFWGAYLVTTQTPGQSALQFQRQLEIKRYEKAFVMLHKLRSGMVRPERDAIGGEHPVEVDECLLGGRTRGEGHGVHHKATVVGAVEVRKRQDAEARAAKHRQEHDGGVPLKKLVYAGRLRLRVVDGRRATRLETFVTDNVAKGPPRQNGCRLFRSCICGSGTHIVVGGCGACGRRLARWLTCSVIHGKPAGARSASSTNPQPDAAPISARIPGTCFNKQGAMREHFGTIRTSIQRQSGGAVVATGERGVGRRLA